MVQEAGTFERIVWRSARKKCTQNWRFPCSICYGQMCYRL